MPQTIKTSTNAENGTTKTLIASSDDELGINEPSINPTLAGATFRHKGKLYRYNENEEIVRFDPPSLKKSRVSAKLKP